VKCFQIGSVLPFNIWGLSCKYVNIGNPSTIIHASIVWPDYHMEYTAPVWDPHPRKEHDLLEHTQKFSCKMITEAGIEATISS